MILVTGATGNVGRALVRQLEAQHRPLRLLLRDPARGAAFAAHIDRATGDLDRPDTLARAFAGVDRVFLLTPGIGLAHTEHALEAALAAGVQQMVHLSSINVIGTPVPAMGRWHHAREEMIRQSGIPATFLRPGGFMTNALEWISSIRDEGYVLDAVGPGRFAPIDPADIAAVAAVVLTASGHAGKAYTLTGGELLTISEQVQILAAALGRPIAVREAASPDDVVRSRFPNGAPKDLVEAILDGCARMRADTTGVRTDAVEQLLGRPPAAFADWCARHAEAFR